MAGMDQKDSYTTSLSPRSSSIWKWHMHVSFCLVMIHFALCSLWLSSAQDALHLGRYGPGQLCRDTEAALVVFLGSGMCLAGFPGDDSRCVLGRYGSEGQFVACRLVRQWHVQGWFAGYVAFRVVFPRLSAFVVDNGGSTWLVLLVTMHITSACSLFVGSGTASRVLTWTRLLCSTDARCRRAENCGAPQLQFVDQVESSLFGNRDSYAQCNCAVVCCHGRCLLDSRGVVLGALHTGAGPRGSCPQGYDPRDWVHNRGAASPEIRH